MRRIALLGLTVALGGCGFNTWWNPPFTTGLDPNRPVSNSDNLRRVMGEDVPVTPLLTEAGDIWPGPPPEPTTLLQDLDRRALGEGEQPMPSPNPVRGSSPGPLGLGQPVILGPPPASSSASAPFNAQPPRDLRGQTYQSPSGSVTTTGGTPAYQSGVTTGGATAVIVPNGNGTSTIIRGDGKIDTVQTPR